jgi:hypothetical protein
VPGPASESQLIKNVGFAPQGAIRCKNGSRSVRRLCC